MANPDRKLINESFEGGTLIPFPASEPSQSSQSSITTTMIDEIFANPQFDQKLQTALEGRVWNKWIRSLSNLLADDDPFGAVYLADLKPDVIPWQTVSTLRSLYHVKDLSDSISFDDGLDD